MYLTQRNFLNTTKPTCAGAHLRFIICYAGIGTSIKTRADMIQTEKNCQQFNIKNTSFPIRKLFSGIEYCYYNSIVVCVGVLRLCIPLELLKSKYFHSPGILYENSSIYVRISLHKAVLSIFALFFLCFSETVDFTSLKNRTVRNLLRQILPLELRSM